MWNVCPRCSTFVHCLSRWRALAGKAECAKNASFIMYAPSGVAESTEERTTAMNYFKLLAPKALWLGTIGIATILLGWTPSCKAQEGSSARFTDTGVEDVYPLKPPAKKLAKTHLPARFIPTRASNQAIARKQNPHPAARKRNVVFAPGM